MSINKDVIKQCLISIKRGVSFLAKFFAFSYNTESNNLKHS